MTLFNQQLQKHKDIFNSLETRKYDKKAMPEVLSYLKTEYEKTKGNTVYNRPFTDYIAKLHNTPTDLIKHLETEVYLAQHDYRDELDAIEVQKMLDAGYLPLDNNVTYRGKIELVAIKNIDWFTNNINKQATLKDTPRGLFVVPKGNRTRGWFISSLEKAFYKPLTK